MTGVGTIHPEKTLFFRVAAGQATDNATGVVYEFSTSVNAANPIVYNTKTKLWFTLSWAEIINLAKEAGIDGNVKKKKARP